jgi:hypothetical protein
MNRAACPLVPCSGRSAAEVLSSAAGGRSRGRKRVPCRRHHLRPGDHVPPSGSRPTDVTVDAVFHTE